MVSILLTILISTYPWPIRQFNTAHGVSATLGDARGSVSSPRFHRGIDIPAGVGTKVYSIISDTARWGGSGVNTYVRVGDYWYIHINNRTKQDSLVLGILDTINTPPDTIGKVLDYPNGDHLHFQIGPSSGPFVNPLSYSGGPVGYDDTGDPTCSIDFWRQGSEGGTAQQLVGVLDGKVDIRAYCQDIQTSGGSNQTSGIYRLDWFIRNINTGQSFGPFQTTIFPQVQPPNNGNPVLLVYDRHNYSDHSPFYYWTTNPIISNQVEDRYWNTKQKINEPDSVDADSIENAKFPDGNYWVKVTAYDIRENYDPESVYVHVDNFKPRVKETHFAVIKRSTVIKYFVVIKRSTVIERLRLETYFAEGNFLNYKILNINIKLNRTFFEIICTLDRHYNIYTIKQEKIRYEGLAEVLPSEGLDAFCFNYLRYLF